MKLATTAIILSNLAYVQADVTECANSVALAQTCVRTCVAKKSPDEAYENTLLYCVDQDNVFNRSQQLEDCCEMENECETSMQAADTCLKGTFTDVKEKATDYLTCIYGARENGTCLFANYCISLLTGGVEQGFENDFSVGAEQRLDNMTRDAQTCSDMDQFGVDACSTVAGCCQPCQEKIANVVNAVTNEILIPAYGNGAFSSCSAKTCGEYLATRQLETTEESSNGTASLEVSKAATAAALAEECQEGLTNDIVVFDENTAVENYLDCLYKKMGKIIAETEEDTEENSSSASFTTTATSIGMAAIAATFLV